MLYISRKDSENRFNEYANTATPYFVSDIVEQSSKLEWGTLLKFNFVRFSRAFFCVNFHDVRYHLIVAETTFSSLPLSAPRFDVFFSVASAIKNSGSGN